MAVEILTREDLKPFHDFMERLVGIIEKQHKELVSLKDNRLMSVEDVINYTGFSRTWVVSKKEEIGYSATGKDIRFYKDDVDAYFKKNRVQFKK